MRSGLEIIHYFGKTIYLIIVIPAEAGIHCNDRMPDQVRHDDL